MQDNMESSTASLLEDGVGAKHFRFFDLPLEIRRLIMSFLFHYKHPLDIDFRTIRTLSLLPVCHRWYDEVVGVFFGSNTFRLLPTHPKAVTKRAKPLISNFTSLQRAAITSVDLRLGPFWTQPPKCWKLDHKAGLEDLVSLRKLRVFVQIDPSQPIFKGFRGPGKEFYTHFCGDLLKEIFTRVPNLEEVELDGELSVAKDGPLLSELAQQVRNADKKLSWGRNQASIQNEVDFLDEIYLTTRKMYELSLLPSHTVQMPA